MSEKVICPYCQDLTEIEPWDYEHYDGTEEYQCQKCEKNFEVSAEPTIHYSACGQADCLNGGEHKWRQITGAPEIHFRGKYRCEDCSATKEIKEELATPEQYKEYFGD